MTTAFLSKSMLVTSCERISMPASWYHSFERRAILVASGMSAFESLGLSIISAEGSFVRIVILPVYLFSRRDWIRPIVPLPLFFCFVG